MWKPKGMYPSMNMADGRRWPRDTLRGTTTKLEKNIVQSSPNSASSDDIEEVVILPSETTVPLEESSSKDTEKKVEVASEMEKKEGDESPKIAQEPGKEKEAVVNGLVRVIGQMMNRRQVVMSIVSMIFGMFCIYMAKYRDLNDLGYSSIHVNAFTLMRIMLIYGALQLALGSTFFLTCSVTSIAIRRGQKWGARIIVGLFGTFFYLCLVVVTIVAGIIGFYQVMQMYSQVDYVDVSLESYIDQTFYRCAIVVFSFHIWFSVSKCCCCR